MHLTQRTLILLGIVASLFATPSLAQSPNGAGVGLDPAGNGAGVGNNPSSNGSGTGTTSQPQSASASTSTIGDISEADINTFLKFVTTKALQYVLVIAAIFIILAGYLYITSLGNQAKVEQAKQMLLYVMIGVLVVLGAYLVVNTIAGQLGTSTGM